MIEQTEWSLERRVYFAGTDRGGIINPRNMIKMSDSREKSFQYRNVCRETRVNEFD